MYVDSYVQLPKERTCSQLILFKPIGKGNFRQRNSYPFCRVCSQLILFKPIGKVQSSTDTIVFSWKGSSQLILFKPIGKVLLTLKKKTSPIHVFFSGREFPTNPI